MNGGDDTLLPEEMKKKRCSIGYGIIDDFKRTVGTHWKQEMTNFNQKTVAVSFFLFFACIAPAITFGAIYEKATSNWIGAIEMILATAWGGIFYALVGGQPMVINGGTGPILAFTEIIYKLAKSMDVPFLTLNAWIGLWVAFYMLITSIFGLNRIIQYATRFTDEIFSFLIALIFIINALGNPFAPVGIYYYFDPNHQSHEYHSDDEDYSYLAAALLSLLICFGTLWLSFQLRKAKFSPFFYNQLGRNIVTDFSVVISIVLMTVIANVGFRSIETETLNVPSTFSPTYSCCTVDCVSNWPDDCPEEAQPYGQRPWVVDLFNLNGKGWVPFIAAGPAILAFILVFLDDGITWHLINSPQHKLTHGDAYNYDTIIVGIIVAVNSMLGLPWLVAATVRSLNHIHAMAEKSQHGKILHVHETRLTQLFIHLLCAVTLFALDVLKLIPVPVLYGVFLFMGLVSLGTNTFWVRITMFFMEPSKFPMEPFSQHMTPKRIYLYTSIQLALFALLYVVKAIKLIAIAFPLVIFACIPFRLYVLPRIFTQKELVMIDGTENQVNEWLKSEENQKKEEQQQKEKNQEEIPEENVKDIDDDEDQIQPLPTIEFSTPKLNRQKSQSAPLGYLFTEPPEALITKKEIREYEDVGMNSDGTPIDPLTNPRINRVKQVSFPTYILMAEAKRQVEHNYFFG